MFNTLPTDPAVFTEWEWKDYEPYYYRLLDSNLTPETVDQWLKDWSAISARAYETYSRFSVAKSQNTADETAKKNYFRFLETILPELQKMEQKLREELLSSGLQPDNFDTVLRNMRAEVALFREENLPLITEARKLSSAYDEVMGSVVVNWNGEDKTRDQMNVIYHAEPDRAVREKAWRATADQLLSKRDAIYDLWKKVLPLRHQMAQNAGKADFREYQWQAMGRFDYSPQDTINFHNAIEQVVVPAAERMYARRKQQLGVDTLRPWDLFVDAQGRDPLHPFKDVSDLESISETILTKVDPVLGGYYKDMRTNNLLDLPNRKNKAPGGYCTGYPTMQRPFIFMNAVGLHDDVQTLLHEAGHAFHVFESNSQPYLQQQDYPIEFAEVASMSMELLSAPYLSADKGGFYSEADAARARIEHLEQMIAFWPYMATMDAFQHWVYTNLDAAMNPDNCNDKWLELWSRFMRGVDMSGLGDMALTGWHGKYLGWTFKLHIHHYPFYYVEYGIAQLGAAQVWRGSLTDQAGAVAKYRKALALGGSAPLPMLYQTAGAKLSFDAETLGSAVELIESTINSLSVN
jgi:oligoendopeptidase F